MKAKSDLLIIAIIFNLSPLVVATDLRAMS